jgi:precorrin-6A/cobalt-precorrin-6A reductase
MLRVLLLAGSTEASSIARRLESAADDDDVIVSFAGRTRERVALPGRVRVGGFGGPSGLARYLEEEGVGAVVDATHPFAARMPWNAAEACATCGVPRLRVCRPPWVARPRDRWCAVDDLEAATTAIEQLGVRRVFLTTGRQELAPFARLRDVWYLVRAIEPPDPMPLVNAHVVLARGPFDESSEFELMRRHRIEAVVAKNSGGDAAAAKLAAARRLGLPVVMVERPPMPAGPRVTGVDDALAWLDRVRAAARTVAPRRRQSAGG